MKVAVMGAGAVGGYYGGVLARDGVDVTLICRGAKRDAIRERGLRVESHWGQFTVNPFATDDPGEVGPVDLVLHCVKLYSNDEAVPLLRPLVGDETNILTIQNGVTSGQRLADEFGWGKVLQGATYIEAAIAAPGHIEQTGSAARIEFGERDGTASDRAEAIRTLLDRPGIQVAVSSDIASTLWTKLVAVAAFGTVMTVSRSALPAVLSWPEGTATIRTVMEEIVAVGKARGIDFPARRGRRTICGCGRRGRRVRVIPADGHASRKTVGSGRTAGRSGSNGPGHGDTRPGEFGARDGPRTVQERQPGRKLRGMGPTPGGVKRLFACPR